MPARLKTLDSFASLSLDTPDEIRRIRNVLRDAGYTERSVQQVLDVPELPSFRRRLEGLPLYLWRTRGGSPPKILVRLFLLRQTISVDDLRSVIEPTEITNWIDSGLLRVEGRDVTASVELSPNKNLMLAADWPDDTQASLYEVMGIAASSRTLAQATIQRHVRATLDLGTGCGVLALLAAAHSEQIVAVDSNPRALRMAKFNAQFNGLSDIEFLEGDLFEPVRERQFDLIVCNPPFIVAPEQLYLHSHSDMPLDRLCETIVRTAPAFLFEGGYCQLLCNWVEFAEEDWRGRLASWFDGSGCDAWVLHSHSEDAADYAFNRISNFTLSAEQRYKELNTWMEYYVRERVEAIGFGLITMRRSNRASNWFKCESWPEMIGACGDAIEGGFAARDFLESHPDDQELLEARVRRAPNLQWRQDHDICDLGSAAPTSGEDPNQFAPRFLKVVRRLIELGFLLPVQRSTNQPEY